MAFAKRFIEGCVQKGRARSKDAYCEGELRNQLTIIFIVAIIKNLLEVSILFLYAYFLKIWLILLGWYSNFEKMSERTQTPKGGRTIC